MKNILIKIVFMVSLLCVFCSCSFMDNLFNKPDTSTVFGTYASEDGNIYYTLREDYTWESHDNCGTFTYVEAEETVYFTTESGVEFSFEVIDNELLRYEFMDENIGISIYHYYMKK